jgi:hypothetical protein
MTAVIAACSEWRRYHADREDQYLDVPGCGRMTIRPHYAGAGYVLRVKGEAAGIFRTIEAAMQAAADKCRVDPPRSTVPIVIRCANCGHCAPAPKRLADLAGKILKCTQCSTRQRADLAQIIDAIYAEAAANRLSLH